MVKKPRLERLTDEVYESYVKKQRGLRPAAKRPWLEWSSTKKRQVYVQYKKNGYAWLKNEYKESCPPASTVNGWHCQEGDVIKKPGRPPLLRPDEEQIVLNVFRQVWDVCTTAFWPIFDRQVRSLGAVVDHEALTGLANETLEKTRKAPQVLQKTWSKSFKKRFQISNMRSGLSTFLPFSLFTFYPPSDKFKTTFYPCSSD